MPVAPPLLSLQGEAWLGALPVKTVARAKAGIQNQILRVPKASRNFLDLDFLICEKRARLSRRH